MIEADLQIYVTALFILMAVSIVAFLLIIRVINRSEAPATYLVFYNIYFILGLVGWLALWVRDAAHINIDLNVSVVFYVLVSLFLLLAVAECDRRKPRILLIGGIHLLAAALSLLLDTDTDRISFVASYTVVAYPFIFIISLKSALKRHNIGYGIISFASLIVLCIAPIQLYKLIITGDPNSAYNLSLVGSSCGFILVGIGFLSSVLINKHHMLAELALNDPLTGLLNRRGMDASLNIILAMGKRHNRCISAITTDIDYFKRVNDLYGHAAGDFVLKQFAKVLTEMLRNYDVCCRLGGEEFILLLPETSSGNALAVAERIRKSIEKLVINYESHTIALTSSFGVATHCGDFDIDYLIKDADRALYQAKSGGRNKVCVAEMGV